MYSSNSIFKRAINFAKSVMLLGTAVVGTLLMSFTTVERDEAPEKRDEVGDVKVERVMLREAGHNLNAVMGALAVIDPAWAKGLPKAKATKVMGKKSATIVVYGVIGNAGGNLQLTPMPVSPTGGECGEEEYPCRIQFDTATLPIQNTGSGNFVTDDPGKYTAIGWGGYN